jgi:hypothetical protein
MVGRSKRILGSLVAAAAFCFASSSMAVMQPNGTMIPVIDASVMACTDKNVEVCLDLAEGDPASIDSRVDALVAPETFQPTCQLTFRPLVKGGSIWDVFGWYNVREDATGKPMKPLPAELYGMFVTNDFKTGMQLAATPPIVLDLGVEAAAGRYKGGSIGFFLVSSGGTLGINPTTHRILDGGGNPLQNPEYQFYTQHALNVGSTPTATTYNVLTWESTTKKNTFYFGWEDLPPTAAIDNDFDDFLFSVEGVQCGGGGQPCETGLMGVCAAGTLQCKKSVITCVQNVPESGELCNALDDDCNGMVDDGELCGMNEICDRGVCVTRCSTGEFRCPDGLVCAATGFCVDPACKEIECPTGQICSAGECVDSCTGIVCPTDRVCRNGGCIDPCVGIDCDEGFACVLGVCTSCECSACGAGLICHDSQCVDTGCDTMTCGAGQHCSMGACVDNCDGASCPVGQLCSAGECVVDPTYVDPLGGGGTDNVGGLGPINPGGSSSSGGSKSTGSGADLGADLVPSEPACGCEVPGGTSRSRAAVLALALAGLAFWRRARRAAPVR